MADADMCPGPDLVHGLLDEAVAAHPHAPAVRDRNGAWDYAELDCATRRAATWLHAQGVRSGDRVAVRCGSVREFLALLFGTVRTGAVFVPLNPAMKHFHLSSVLADAQPRVLVTTDHDVQLLSPVVDCPVRAVPDLSRHQGDGSPEEPVPGPPVSGTDLAMLIYTSGSTSRPKAVMSPHRTIVFATRAIAAQLGYQAQDVVLTAIPLAFDYGLYQIFLSVLAGAELVLSGAEMHTGLMATIHSYGVTVLPVVPSVAEMLLRLASRDKRPAPALRLITNTGAALNPPLIASLRDAFPGVHVVPMFGITECKRVTILEPDGDLVRPCSVGRALPGTEVLILDDSGRQLRPGETGEITVRGPHVMAGYWRAPQLTAERFRTDPVSGETVLHTGDYGYLDDEGYLYFQGRRDDIFKRRGVRMSALEIEAAALDIPGVSACAVLPPADGRDMALFAVSDLSPNEITTRLGERLEVAKLPPRCRVLPELPLTANGKTDKQRLTALLDE